LYIFRVRIKLDCLFWWGNHTWLFGARQRVGTDGWRVLTEERGDLFNWGMSRTRYTGILSVTQLPTPMQISAAVCSPDAGGVYRCSVNWGEEQGVRRDFGREIDVTLLDFGREIDVTLLTQ